MERLNIALVGAGQIAQNFHIPIYHKLPHVNLVAIFDEDEHKAGLIAEKYAIPKVCKTIDEVVNSEEVQAVDICTPTDSHLDIALKCFANKKHVLIEKPVARNLKEAIQIHEAAEESKSIAMVAMNQRFRYDARLIKNYIQTDEIGNVFYVQTGWLQKASSKDWKTRAALAGGGVVIDLGVSLIDSLLWFNDFQSVKRIFSKIYHHQTKKLEDVCVANIEFDNGSYAALEMSWSLFNTRGNFYCNVHGEKGSIKINPLEIYRNEGGVFVPEQPKDDISKAEIYKRSFESEIKHFINALLGYGPVISTTDEAVKTMEVVDGIYRSARENKEIMMEI